MRGVPRAGSSGGQLRAGHKIRRGGSRYTIGGFPAVTLVGLLGFVTGSIFLFLFATNAELGLTSNLAYTIVGGILSFSAIWYVVTKLARRSGGINVEYAFKEIPPE